MSAPHPAHGRPQRITIEGRYVRLEPLGPQHARDLYRAASAPDADQRFRYLGELLPPRNETEMAAWIAHAAPKDDPLYYTVADRANGRAAGYQALMRIVPEHGVIEIGSIYWGPELARTRAATE